MAKITINQDSLKPRKEWKRHKVVDGNNIYRILPPFGDVETHNNYPFKYWRVIWGLTDPETGKMKPVNSPMNSPEGACPVHDYLTLFNAVIDEQKARLEQQGYTEDQIKTELELARKLAWDLRAQKIYSYNAVDKSGTVGILDLKTTAHNAMKSEMMRYIKDYNQDPTSLDSEDDNSGVWFNIMREGKRKDTKYSVAINYVTEKDDRGRLVKIDDRSPLPENVAENYDTSGFDLFTLYRTPTYDELKTTLILNLATVAESIPLSVIEGYTLADIGMDNVDEVVEEELPKEEPAKTKGKKTVNLALGGDDDSEPKTTTPVAAQKPAQKPAQVNENPSNDDFMAMAADILNN